MRSYPPFVVYSLIKKLRFGLGTYIGNSRQLFPIRSLGRFKHLMVSDNTDLCAEGFQRSGNSYFYIQFHKNNPDVSVAHKLHGSVQILYAVEKKIPAVVLIRKPSDCVASLLAWDNRISVGMCLRAYQNFYKNLIAVKEDVLIIKFEDLIKDYSGQITLLNEKFDTTFDTTTLSPKRLEKRSLRNTEKRGLYKSHFPNAYKEKVKAQLMDQIREHHNYTKALSIYRDFVG